MLRALHDYHAMYDDKRSLSIVDALKCAELTPLQHMCLELGG